MDEKMMAAVLEDLNKMVVREVEISQSGAVFQAGEILDSQIVDIQITQSLQIRGTDGTGRFPDCRPYCGL